MAGRALSGAQRPRARRYALLSASLRQYGPSVNSPVGVYFVETIVALTAVLALCVLVLYGARRLGVGRPVGPIELLGRLPLEARRSIYLVRVVDQVLIIGASEAGLRKLGELPRSALTDGDVAQSVPRFAEVLSAALGRSKPPASTPTERAEAERPDPSEPPGGAR
jgi:flagellar protein FliO/FliZ